MVGERRIGKTSFLKYISHPDARREHGLGPGKSNFVFVDFQELASDATPTALVALGVSGDSVIGMLVERLNDLHGYVRVAAAEALGKLGVRGKKKILDGLIKLLDDGYYSHYHDKYVRDAAFDALWVLTPHSVAEPVS